MVLWRRIAPKTARSASRLWGSGRSSALAAGIRGSPRGNGAGLHYALNLSGRNPDGPAPPHENDATICDPSTHASDPQAPSFGSFLHRVQPHTWASRKRSTHMG